MNPRPSPSPKQGKLPIMVTTLAFLTTLFCTIAAHRPYSSLSRARICIPFMEPRNRFPARRAGTTTLFVVLARQAGGIDSSESIPGLHKRLQIRAQ
jgi:hypothetical protein